MIPAPPLESSPRPHRQRRKQARPQELIDAALQLFVERGFAATRMEEIAALAGVSKGTLYLYYPSKKELLQAVIRERLSSQIQAVAAEVALHQGSHAEMLREIFAKWWLQAYDNPASGVFKLIITEVRGFPDIAQFYQREVVAPGQQLIGGVVAGGIASGEFRKVDVEAAVHSLVLPMVMHCVHKHSLGACAPIESLLDPRRFVHQHIDLVVRGLLAQPPVAAPAAKKNKQR